MKSGERILRREYLISAAVLSSAGLAGCTGSDGGSNPEDGERTQSNSGSDEILIEYSISEPKTHEQIPEDVVEHPNPEDFYWIVVEFELVTGSFDAGDIMGLTQVRSNGTNHFTRAIIITSPEEVRLTTSDGEYMMEEGTSGDAYYRTPEEPEEPEWVIEQLRNQHGSIETRRG